MLNRYIHLFVPPFGVGLRLTLVKTIQSRCRFFVFLFLLLLGINWSAFSQTNLPSYTPGTTYWGRTDANFHYIEYIAGNMPLIISAGHGGSLNPNELPDRTYGTFNTDTDTDNLARAIRTACFNRYGRYPHVIICNIDRQKIDCNREVVEGAQGNANTILAYNEYHTFIARAKQSVSDAYGRGLILDMHGHGHTIQRLEIGYNTDSGDLFKTTLSTTDRNESSIHELGLRTRVSFDQLVRGDFSLGTLLASRGYRSVPSSSDLNQGTNSASAYNDYFTGGYTVEIYGTKGSLPGAINAIQIECNMTGVRDSSANRATFSTNLIDALEQYFPKHVGMALNTLAPPPILSRFADQVTQEDTPTAVLPLTLDDASASLAASISNSALVSSTGMVFGGSGGSRTLQVSPSLNAHGANAIITVSATTPAGGIGVEWFTLTVNPVNDAPTFASVSDRTVNPGTSLSIPATATDVEGSALTYSLVACPAGATVSSNGLFQWRPSIAQAGSTYAITIRATEAGATPLSSNLSFQTTVNSALKPTAVAGWNLVAGNPVPQLQVSVAQGQLGPDYIVQASTDLMNWSNLSTQTPATFPWVWTDTDTSLFSKRFYRLNLGP